ncbi:hypothetical protein Tco_0347413 [Tanacetum coccineum]
MLTQQDINAIRAQRLADTHDPLALMANTQTLFHPDQSSLITYLQHPQPNNNFIQQPSFNTNYMPQPMQNFEDSSDSTTAMNKALALIAKAFKINTIPTNNNQRIGQNVVQNPGIQIVENMNGLSVVSEIANQYGNGNFVTAPSEGNDNGINDAYEETKRVKVNCTLEDTLQQASTYGTQSENAPIYDSDGSTEQQANSDSNSYSSTRVNNTAKTRRPHSRSNSNTDRVLSKSKSSCLSNNVEKIEENHWNSQIPKNQKHMSSECNNITLAIRNDKSEIVYVMCKQCLVTANHDVCVLNYVNDMNSRTDNQSANDSGFELTRFSDADYAGCKDTFKSTTGRAQFLGEKLVSWSSKKQDCTTLSTVEAEYVYLSACCAQVN